MSADAFGQALLRRESTLAREMEVAVDISRNIVSGALNVDDALTIRVRGVMPAITGEEESEEPYTTGFNLTPEQARELAHDLIVAAEILATRNVELEPEPAFDLQTVWVSRS